MDTPPPPPPPPPSSGLPPPPPPPPATPAPKKSNTTLIVILCIVGFLFLIIAGCVGACFYGIHKAKEYGESAQKNPQYAAITLAATLNPDLQIVSKDEATGIVNVRNKKTGEVVRIDSKAYSADNIAKAMEDFAKGMKLPPPSNDTSESTSSSSSSEEEKPHATERTSSSSDSSTDITVSPARAAALSDVLKKFPNYVPTYPSGKTSEATLNSFAGYTAGTYAFHTTDKPEAVVEYYEKKITSAGNFAVASKTSDTNDYGPTSNLMATRSNPAGTFSVSAESQQRGTKVVVSFTQR